MIVGRITSREEAVRIFKDNDLYEAREWVIARKGLSTPLHLNRQLSPQVTKQLRFLSGKPGRSKGLLFVSANNLDRQTTRIVRELTLESASLLDEIIEMTDKQPGLGQRITISNNRLRDHRRMDARSLRE